MQLCIMSDNERAPVGESEASPEFRVIERSTDSECISDYVDRLENHCAIVSLVWDAESQDMDLSPWVPYTSSAQRQVMESAIDLQHTAKQLLMQMIVSDSPGALKCDGVHGSLAPACHHPVTPATIVVDMASPHSTSEQDPPEVNADNLLFEDVSPQTVSAGHPGSCTSLVVTSPQLVAHGRHVCLPHHALECGTVSTDAADSPGLTSDLGTMVLTNRGPRQSVPPTSCQVMPSLAPLYSSI